MAKAAASSSLEDLDLSGEEVQRLTSAFQDPEFRRMFSQYAEELTDPQNRRRYEAEITALERERGVEVRFVHPEPGHVLRTSLDGTRRCFVNVCSNALVGAPSSQPGSGGDRGAAPGSHWSLPYSLAPGREYAGRSSSRYMVYDVVFHPDALALARRHEGFRQMLDATALEAVEKQFGVKLDRRNAKTLKAKYKGTPEAAVLRTPLPGFIPAKPEREPKGPLPDFPYPYQNSAAPGPRVPSPPEAALQPAPTEPRYSVVQRHHVDLQDYRCSRDSAPSPVPHELVVTIELPLLRSAEQAALEVTGKLLCLDSKKPDYRLRLSLPYPVDDGRGKAQFNKARRQLVVTLPVVLPAARREPAVAVAAAAAAPEESADRSGTDGQACASAREGETRLTGSRAEDGGRDTCVAGAAGSGTLGFNLPENFTFPCCFSRNLLGSYIESGRGDSSVETREKSEGAGGERSARAMGGPGTKSGEPLCPPLLCNQDKETLTLLIQVPRIQPQSLQGDLNPLWYKLRFSTQDLVYSFFLQFAPENKLSTTEPVISVSSNNAVIELAKSPESRGHWREWYYGVNNDSLELQECSNSDHLQGKEERVNEESHLTEKEYIEHCNTSTTDSDSSIAVKALQIDSFGSVTCFQQESLDVSQMILGKSQQPESKMQSEFIKEKSATCSNEEKDNLNESVITEEKETDGDHLSSLLNKTTVHNIPGFDSIKETNMQDGSVQVIKDHVTNCAFSFQNSLLYDLD
uniref:Protein kintoun n=1 Tax=Nomascus leucogenys TaxID=61853 RepID=A0A2I3GLR4_NOMLE